MTLRFGELAALRRRDIDLAGRLVVVRRAQAELQDGRLFDKAPKSAAGVRTVSFADRLGAMIRDGGGDPSGKVDEDSTRA